MITLRECPTMYVYITSLKISCIKEEFVHTSLYITPKQSNSSNFPFITLLHTNICEILLILFLLKKTFFTLCFPSSDPILPLRTG